jgi:TetR/AcrR family fatty acid metabolism transcriptional regulator
MPDADKNAFQETLVAARRQQILDAATKVFAANGFHRTTIRDVAREAGIADGTIYNYFANKSALLLAILDRLNETEQRETHFAGPAAGDPEHFLGAYLQHRFEQFAVAGLDLFRVALPELLVDAELRERYQQQVLAPTFTLAETYFQALAARGLLQTSDPILTARAVPALVLGLILMRLLDDPYLEAHWNELPAWLADFIFHGLAGTKGDPDAHPDADSAAGEPGESAV